MKKERLASTSYKHGCASRLDRHFLQGMKAVDGRCRVETGEWKEEAGQKEGDEEKRGVEMREERRTKENMFADEKSKA